jgi:putative redox protein
MEENIRWVSAVIGQDAYKTEIRTDTHTVVGDEPISSGGKDLGPGPGDFLRMSLASCTAITLRMYADRKKLAIREIEVKVYSVEVEGTTIFNRSISIDGVVTDQQRKRLSQIADACPVHKILTNPIRIETKFT